MYAVSCAWLSLPLQETLLLHALHTYARRLSGPYHPVARQLLLLLHHLQPLLPWRPKHQVLAGTSLRPLCYYTTMFLATCNPPSMLDAAQPQLQLPQLLHAVLLLLPQPLQLQLLIALQSFQMLSLLLQEQCLCAVSLCLQLGGHLVHLAACWRVHSLQRWGMELQGWLWLWLLLPPLGLLSLPSP